MSTCKPHLKKREKKVRFGGDVVVAIKYMEKDLEDMHTVYKLYDDKGRHVGSKRQYQTAKELYKQNPADKESERRYEMHQRQF
jgi:hypothetical protein